MLDAVRFAGAILVGAMVATAGAAPHKGRVIRIERPRGEAAPRLCAMGMRLCVGRPEVGDLLTLVSPSRQAIVGEFRISAVSEVKNLCSTSRNVSRINGAVLHGRVDLNDDVLGVRGLVVKPTAQVLANGTSPSGRTEETVLVTLDNDGDGRADLVIVRYTCDDHNRPVAGADRVCFDTYVERDDHLTRASQDVVQTCT